VIIIEFRSGSFFQNLEADHGGPRETAQRFTSTDEANAFMRTHTWIAFYGGMAVLAHGGKR
jgi:hypothetical protein